jgi:3-dehydroquinate synthase
VDEQVQEWFSHYFPAIPFITIQAAETAKTLETVEKLTLALLSEEADRTFFLLGVGGGIVCDITGFLASTYMRGIRFGFIPTTLLAQVDAALGGKNGVNVGGYKNITGTFTQPEFVLCTTDVLATLPERVFNAGMSEVIKAALIADASLFEFIERHTPEIVNRKEPALGEIIRRAAQIKLDIVARDEKEKGERRKLNLGHTLGHAIERSVKNIMHGEAVSIGLAYAARFSHRQGWLTEADVFRITALLERFRLPVDSIIPVEDLQETMMKDKKKSGVLLHYIALTAIGKAVEVDVNLPDLNFLHP